MGYYSRGGMDLIPLCVGFNASGDFFFLFHELLGLCLGFFLFHISTLCFQGMIDVENVMDC